MSPLSHTAISLATSGIFYAATRSIEGVLVCFFSGILIDIDHYLDLWIYKKRITLSLKDVYYFCDGEKGGRLHLIFHSYELLALLWIAILGLRLNAIWLGLAVGLTVHIVLDQFYNQLKPAAYFLVYRIKHQFHKSCIFPQERYVRMK